MYLKRIFKYKKIIKINIIFLLIFTILPSLSLFTYKRIRSLYYATINKSLNPIANYPIYEDKNIAHEIFIDYQSLKNEYKSFIGWRPLKTNKKHIKINGNYHTRVSEGEEINNSTWFFGGSTMWGTGVSDSETIPSIFSKVSGQKVMNFGQLSWTSRQSLAQLITLLGDGLKPSKVIFYDGVNDVNIGCRSEIKDVSVHARENVIKNALNNNLLFKISKDLKYPIDKLIQKFKNSRYTYDCDLNEYKVNQIADHLINNWYTAYLILKAKNINFYAILQPSIFTSEAPYDYFSKKEINLLSNKRKQFNTVNKVIVKKIKSKCKQDKLFCNSIIDGQGWIKTKSKIFLDFSHLNSEGNFIIARKMLLEINK